MRSTETTKTAEQTAQLRFEATVSWDRPLTHDKDDVSRLQKRLSQIPVDGDVTITELTDTSATIHVTSTEQRMNHSVGAITTKARKAVRSYNRSIDGDSLNKIPIPYGKGLKKKHIRWANEGKERHEISEHIPAEAWKIAQEKAEKHDFDGAPSLEPDISIRTLEA